MLGYRNILVLGLSAFLASEAYPQHGRSPTPGGGNQFSTAGLSQIATRNNRNLQMRAEGGQGGAQAADAKGGAGGAGGGGGGGGLMYKPREQDKLSPDKGDDAGVAKEDQKAMQEAEKEFNKNVDKMTQSLYQQIEKSKIPESPELLKEIANRSANVPQMSGVGAQAVAGIIGDEKNLGDTISKMATTQAMAFANAPKALPAAKAAPPTMAEQIAAATQGGGGSSQGTAIGLAAQAPGSGGTSVPQRISGPGANLGGGVHAAREVTHFTRGLLYNAPAPSKTAGWTKE